ncbi:uncharacterized protein LOC133785742 [Humulus lupulus]|uniref:uncharacterized protein LOC133785742 n=1 Tax=Humulus lupulus TaxID=3486 RepID=UPI002B41194F|nr:uncharacterized protein LOC133785742 [Humulus lupulus]
MTDVENGVKQLVTKANLRLVGILAPHQDVRESTAGSATGEEIPEKHPDVSQPPRRRTTGVTIEEPSSTTRAAAPPAPSGKGKKKASKPSAPIDESSYENDMPSEEMFNLYSVPDAPAIKKKTSRRHRRESSKEPLVKKTRIEDPPAAGPSKNTTPPPSPLERQSLPVLAGSTPPPPAPIDQTQPAAPVQTGDDLSSRALKSAKERMTWILKHEHSREAMAGTESMDVDHILNRALNELASAMLTMTAGRLRSGVITEQSKAFEQRHAEELKVIEEKYTEQLKAAQKENAALLEEKNKLAEEMKQQQVALNKALEAKERYKESHLTNFREAKRLEAALIESRQEADKLEARINDLEKANTSNLERYKGTTSKCFHDFWKHNQGADFSYLSQCMRQTEIARCVALLEEEEGVKTPASHEISLATGIEGIENEVEAAVDQENPQDPPAS